MGIFHSYVKLPEGIHWKTANQTMPIGHGPHLQSKDLIFTAAPGWWRKIHEQISPLLCSYTISYDYKVVILRILMYLFYMLCYHRKLLCKRMLWSLGCYVIVMYVIMSCPCLVITFGEILKSKPTSSFRKHAWNLTKLFHGSLQEDRAPPAKWSRKTMASGGKY